MTRTSFRPFTIQDYSRVRALWESSDGIGLSDSNSLDGVRRVLDRNPGMSFVAVLDDRVVGAVLACHDGRRGLIHHLAVEPNHRRRGIGHGLVQRALDALGGTGIDKVHLLVFARNDGGRAFWRRIGAAERVDLVLFSMGTTN